MKQKGLPRKTIGKVVHSMYKLLHMLKENHNLLEYESGEDFANSLQRYHCHGTEIIRYGEDDRQIISEDLMVGYHAAFYSDWMDFWLGDIEALDKRFGSREIWKEFYHGTTREALVRQLKEELDYAQSIHVKYVVYHVSQVDLQEVFTYDFKYTDKQVIHATAELINMVMNENDYSFELLLENLWWPGLTLTSPEMTQYLLDQIHYPPRGLLLDIGHLMSTNHDLHTTEEACAYVHKQLDSHGKLCQYIRGVHLHQSITGDYVKNTTIPEFKVDFYERYAQAYSHVLNIDTHEIMVGRGTKELIERISPEYLVYEFVSENRQEREDKLARQSAVFT